MRILLLIVTLFCVFSCGHPSKAVVSSFDTVDVFFTNPVNGVKGWTNGVYNPRGIFTRKDLDDSTSTEGKYDTSWVINLPDSIRDPKTNKPRYDSIRRNWLIPKWYSISKLYITPDPNTRKYYNQ